ncbi:MAG: hypothetical protein E7259_04065 [Lachnospiraceae bacterium]|nr:hypothetical protein [Lachnospiraceae bacterium]
MAKDIKNEEVEEVVEDAVTEEAEDEYDFEDDIEDIEEEVGEYREHEFSLFDNPIEAITVIFMVGYAIFSIVQFINKNTIDVDFITAVEFLFGLAKDLIPAVVLLVACEIYEKLELVLYNLSLNSEYMARYQMNLLEHIYKSEEKNK